MALPRKGDALTSHNDVIWVKNLRFLNLSDSDLKGFVVNDSFHGSYRRGHS